MKAIIENIEPAEVLQTIFNKEEKALFILTRVTSATTLEDLAGCMGKDGALVSIEEIEETEIEPEETQIESEEVKEEVKKEVKTEKKKPPVKEKAPLDMGKVKALRRAGWSYDKIGDEMGVSGPTISNRLKAEGFTL